MTVRTVLAAISGGTASNGAIELSCQLAKRFEAHIEGFHVRVDPREVIMAAGTGFDLPLAGSWIEQLVEDAAKRADETKAAFQAALVRHNIPLVEKPTKGGVSATWRDETGHADRTVSRHARFFDLVILGRSDRVVEQPHSDTVEKTLLESGRPVLLAPAEPVETIGEAIAVGWNGSPQAVRAIVNSLPLLASAKTVTLITIGNEEEGVEEEGAIAMLDYLSWRGIAAKHYIVRSTPGARPGEQLLSGARDSGADLLVMGGYGQAPWRQFLFGSATQQIVGVSLLPLLLSH